MTSGKRRTAALAAVAVLGAGLAISLNAGGAGAAARHASPPRYAGSPQKTCSEPAPSAGFGSATPTQESLDPRAVRKAVAYAQTHLRTSVQIFRNNCRVATGPLDPVTDHVPMQIFSSTKSVISMLAGIAWHEHKIALDAPIGRYLPKGEGDAAHRAITVRDLLTETAGLKESILTEFASVGLDPDIGREALAQPITHKPGTHFDYSQRDPDLLSVVIQDAVGEDIQTFAQKHLFGPLGISKSSYVWLRDRTGHSYGYANLLIPPTQFARLGLLMQNDGRWRGRQIVPAAYIAKARRNQPTNPCYGFLFWHNGGTYCTGANIPSAQTDKGPAVASAPPDMFAMVGALQQNNFMIPSLHMTVTWTGAFGDTAPNLSVLLSASPHSNLYYNFFRILMRGVRDVHVYDPGPYKAPPLDLDVDPRNYLDPAVLARDLFPARDCNVILCSS